MTPEVAIDREMYLRLIIRQDLPCLIEGWQTRQIVVRQTSEGEKINVGFYEPAGDGIFHLSFQELSEENSKKNSCWLDLSLKASIFAPLPSSFLSSARGGYGLDLEVAEGICKVIARRQFADAAEENVFSLPFGNIWRMDEARIVRVELRKDVSSVQVISGKEMVFIPVAPLRKKDAVGGGVLVVTREDLQDQNKIELVRTFLQGRDFQLLR